jgi:hypothetical protein
MNKEILKRIFEIMVKASLQSYIRGVRDGVNHFGVYEEEKLQEFINNKKINALDKEIAFEIILILLSEE